MTDPYDMLAAIYDDFMEPPALTVPLTRHIISEINERLGEGAAQSEAGVTPLTVADLGCGTGRILPELARSGFEIIAVDRSARMLQHAMMRLDDEVPDYDKVLFVLQDLSQLDLGGGVDAMLCLLDTVNHLSGPNQVKAFFRACFLELREGGILIFDVLRLSYMEEELGEQVYYDVDDEHALLWSNAFDPEAQVNTASMTYFYLYDDESYTREDTVVQERYYPPDQLRRWLLETGFSAVEVDGLLTETADHESSSRRHFLLAIK